MTAPILVGTDGSAPADRAVRWAADEAARRGRPLHILHAEEPWAYTVPLYLAPGEKGNLEDLGQGVIIAAEKVAREHRPDIEVTAERVAQATVPALVEHSAGAFELVLGHRGLGGFSSMLLGSVGLRIAEHSTVPVVIVRDEAENDRGEIAVGIDFENGSTALKYAFETAAARGARLRVVHAWRIPDRLLTTADRVQTRQLEEQFRWKAIEAHAPYRRLYPDVEVSEEIVQDHPVAALEHISREVDMIVVGCHDRRVLPSFRLGSTSHGILQHAHCTVAVARERSS